MSTSRFERRIAERRPPALIVLAAGLDGGETGIPPAGLDRGLRGDEIRSDRAGRERQDERERRQAARAPRSASTDLRPASRRQFRRAPSQLAARARNARPRRSRPQDASPDVECKHHAPETRQLTICYAAQPSAPYRRRRCWARFLGRRRNFVTRVSPAPHSLGPADAGAPEPHRLQVVQPHKVRRDRLDQARGLSKLRSARIGGGEWPGLPIRSTTGSANRAPARKAWPSD